LSVTKVICSNADPVSKITSVFNQSGSHHMNYGNLINTSTGANTAAPRAAPINEPSAQQRREVGRFAEKRGIKAVRLAFKLLCKVTPTIAAHLTYQLLSRPPRAAERPWQKTLREQAQTTHLNHSSGRVVVYSWGDGPTVLMVHGWGARATHMGKLINPLVAAGFRVVSFDAPGHGESSGRTTDLVQFASAIAAVAQFAGPIHTLVAHSFGVAMALYARRDWGVQVDRQVLISSFDHCKWFTDAFAGYVGLEPKVMVQARQLMVDRYPGRLDWEQLSVVEMLRRTPEPSLILHDTDDLEIPFQHSLSLLQAAPSAQFYSTSGCGHHRLLGSPGVIERVVRFASLHPNH
jgi:pimeloyl-ACP methyl ester carboxylesterase